MARLHFAAVLFVASLTAGCIIDPNALPDGDDAGPGPQPRPDGGETCLAYPACPPDWSEVLGPCDGPDCTPVSICNQTIYCQRDVDTCVPVFSICEENEEMDDGPCPADDAGCREVEHCGEAFACRERSQCEAQPTCEGYDEQSGLQCGVGEGNCYRREACGAVIFCRTPDACPGTCDDNEYGSPERPCLPYESETCRRAELCDGTVTFCRSQICGAQKAAPDPDGADAAGAQAGEDHAARQRPGVVCPDGTIGLLAQEGGRPCGPDEPECTIVESCGLYGFCRPDMDCDAEPRCADDEADSGIPCGVDEPDCRSMYECGVALWCRSGEACQAVPTCETGSATIYPCLPGEPRCERTSACALTYFCRW